MDPDQLASSEASLSEPALFPIEFISVFIVFLKSFMHVISSLCIICSLGQELFSLDKYILAIYLSLGKYTAQNI